MAKNRPTQRLQKGIREAVIFSQRKGKAQRFMFDTVINREDSEDTRRMLEDIANERRLGVKIKPNYCQIGFQNNTPPFGEWAQDAVTRLEPGEKYFVLVKTDNVGNTVEKALFKNDNGVPVQVPLEKRADHEWEQLVKSIPRGQTGKIDVDETQNYETAPIATSQGFPSVSQDILQPVRDTEVPGTRNKIPKVERQVDTEIPTKRAPEIQPVAPQSQSGFSPEEMAAAEFGIHPANELLPSNTSQLFREDFSEKKSSDSTLMPVDDTQYSDEKTEKDAPVPSLSPSQTTIQFKNDTPVPTRSDDEFQLSAEDFELEEDSEAIVDLDGELGENTRYLERTPTGKLVKPDTGEKILDASAPSLKPVSASPDTEMVPALKSREPSMQDEIKAHLDSLENKDDGYFGQRGDDFNDLNSVPRSLTKEVQVPNVLNSNLRKSDIPFTSDESNKVLGKNDIVKGPISMDDDFLDGAFSPPPSDDVGEDTELNMPPVKDDDFTPGAKTEHLPPKPADGYVLMEEVPPARSAPRAPPKLPVKSDKPGIPVPKNRIEEAMEAAKQEKVKSQEEKIRQVQSVIEAGKNKDFAYISHDYQGVGEINFFILSEFAKKMPDTRFSPPKEFLDILTKAKISADDFAIVQTYKAGGVNLENGVRFSPESVEQQVLSCWAHLYYLKIDNNSSLSDEERETFKKITGIGPLVDGVKSASLKKNIDKFEKKAASLQEEVSKYHALGSYSELVMLSGGKRPSKIKRYAAAAVLALAAGIGGYFLNNSKAPVNNSDLEGKLAQVTTERDSANSKYDKLSKEYQILVNSEKDLRSQLESAKKEKSALEESMKSAVSKEEFDSLSKQYESLKLEEQKIKSQLESVQKEKSALESLLESQKSEYESQLSQKDTLINELNEKYSSYVPKETIDDLVKENEQNKARIDALKGELDSLKGEVEKYRALGKYEDVKDLVDKRNSQQKIAVNSEKVYNIYLGQLERHEVTTDELYRHIICARLTKAMIRSGVELQVWTEFMRLVDKSESNDFGSTKEQSALVAATLMGAIAADVESGKGSFDDSTIEKVVSKYKALRGAKSDSKAYDKKCLSAAELAEQHFLK